MNSMEIAWHHGVTEHAQIVGEHFDNCLIIYALKYVNHK